MWAVHRFRVSSQRNVTILHVLCIFLEITNRMQRNYRSAGTFFGAMIDLEGRICKGHCVCGDGSLSHQGHCCHLLREGERHRNGRVAKNPSLLAAPGRKSCRGDASKPSSTWSPEKLKTRSVNFGSSEKKTERKSREPNRLSHYGQI